MKVIINGRFLIHRVTGVERYAREILSELDKIIEPEGIEMAVPPEVKDIPTYKNIKVVKLGKLHNRLWEHLSFPCNILFVQLLQRLCIQFQLYIFRSIFLEI